VKSADARAELANEARQRLVSRATFKAQISRDHAVIF
jgi:hypothetical protein